MTDFDPFNLKEGVDALRHKKLEHKYIMAAMYNQRVHNTFRAIPLLYEETSVKTTEDEDFNTHETEFWRRLS